MLKALITALAVGTLAVASFALVAQAHHKTGHCIPGILTAGCSVTPQGP